VKSGGHTGGLPSSQVCIVTAFTAPQVAELEPAHASELPPLMTVQPDGQPDAIVSQVVEEHTTVGVGQTGYSGVSLLSQL
jgi:hypothetical protein